MVQPRRFDGLEADPVDFYTAVRDIIASACGSTGCRNPLTVVASLYLLAFLLKPAEATATSST